MKQSRIFLAIFFLAVLVTVFAKSQRSFRTLHGEPIISQIAPRAAAAVETRWIEQKLDHFDAKNQKTWKMRYLANGEFFRNGGPVFIFVGAEWSISPAFITYGHMYDMAEENNGYMFYTEHRYYGQSRPTSNLSVENLKYLTVQQALADIAHFIRTMKATEAGMSNSKFILTGASYGATMVTWFKKLYPDLAVGCWASSAPLLVQPDFQQFKVIAGLSIRQVGGQACYNRIKSATSQLESMFDNKRGAEVKKMLNLCPIFNENNKLDVATLFRSIADHFSAIAQDQSPRGAEIQTECKKLMQGNDDLTGYAKYLKDFLGEGYYCGYISYQLWIDDLREDNANMNRQYRYQTCTQLGWFPTTLGAPTNNQPFGTKMTFEFYQTVCRDAFDRQFTSSSMNNEANKMNNQFGGLAPNVKNVYLTNGGLDPWIGVGVQNKNQATIIPLYGHTKDLGSISSYDTPEMRASKERIAQLVRQWIKA